MEALEKVKAISVKHKGEHNEIKAVILALQGAILYDSVLELLSHINIHVDKMMTQIKSRYN